MRLGLTDTGDFEDDGDDDDDDGSDDGRNRQFPRRRTLLFRLNHISCVVGAVGLQGANEGSQTQTAKVAKEATDERDWKVGVDWLARGDDSRLYGDRGCHFDGF